jgi:hypothetical protein
MRQSVRRDVESGPHVTFRMDATLCGLSGPATCHTCPAATPQGRREFSLRSAGTLIKASFVFRGGKAATSTCMTFETIGFSRVVNMTAAHGPPPFRGFPTGKRRETLRRKAQCDGVADGEERFAGGRKLGHHRQSLQGLGHLLERHVSPRSRAVGERTEEQPLHPHLHARPRGGHRFPLHARRAVFFRTSARTPCCCLPTCGCMARPCRTA